MNNALIAMEPGGAFRVYLALTNQLVNQAAQIHQTSPLAEATLGRVLTGAGLMGLMLKNPQDKLTVQFKGDGPAGEILATAAANGEVKGYISQPDIELPLKKSGKLNVGGAVGQGRLTVIRSSGSGEPYVGQIDIATGEIAEDLTMYFFLSEQQSTSVALGVRIEPDGSASAAGGMIIQMLPEAPFAVVEALETILGQLPPLTELIREITGTGAPLSVETLLDQLCGRIFRDLPPENQPKLLERRQLKWHCGCSTERLEQVLLSLGKADLKEMLEEDQAAELTCQFCCTKYHFDKAHLEMLLRVAVEAEAIRNRRCQAAEAAQPPEPTGGDR